VADKKPSGGYVVESIEYVNPNPRPLGDPFCDPAEVDAALEEVRRSILSQTNPEVPDA
jgi:hypothetical protein